MADDDHLPTPEQILAAHEEIEASYDMDHTGARVAAPKLDLRRLLSETREYEDIYFRAAYLLRSLITSHLFQDGNKRTAWAVTREYLDQHGEAPAVWDVEVERVLRRIRRFDVEELASWLETGDLDHSRLSP